jgi:hypothetical protein
MGSFRLTRSTPSGSLLGFFLSFARRLVYPHLLARRWST